MKLFAKKYVYKVEWAYEPYLPSTVEYVKARDAAHAWRIVKRQHYISITCKDITKIDENMKEPKIMTRLDRVLKLLEEYDSLAAVALNNYCVGQDCRKMLTYLRAEKEQLTQELIEHGCRRKN